jgi:hypothetical protein
MGTVDMNEAISNARRVVALAGPFRNPQSSSPNPGSCAQCLPQVEFHVATVPVYGYVVTVTTSIPLRLRCNLGDK